MRYILAVALICALGAPASFALPMSGAASVSPSKAGPIVQVAKHGRVHAHRQSNSGGGIHPLVGSGDY